MFRIFIDADACPVKQEVFKVAARHALPVILVAGSLMRVPDLPGVTLEVVAQGLDAADNWIVEKIREHDIVITGDVPLAHRCLQKGASVLGHTGKPFTPENIGSILATRDLLSHLRECGAVTGGPPPFEKRDRSRFLQELDKVINATRRKHPFGT